MFLHVSFFFPDLEGIRRHRQNTTAFGVWEASELRKPPAMEIEVRLVIRTCKNAAWHDIKPCRHAKAHLACAKLHRLEVKLWDGTKTDVKVTVDLECHFAGPFERI